MYPMRILQRDSPLGEKLVYLSNFVLISKYANWWITAIFQNSISRGTYGNVPEYHQLSVFILEYGWDMKMPKKVFFRAANTNISIICWKDKLTEGS